MTVGAAASRTHHTAASHSHSAPAATGHASSARSATVSRTRSAKSASRARGHLSRASLVRSRHTLHGQQAIESSRVTEIQQALIREHYLDAEANGTWDAATQAAMQKYQADHGWQTKLLPDSRALKALGLGADYSDAINGKTASFSAPPPISTIPSSQAAGFAAASGTGSDH